MIEKVFAECLDVGYFETTPVLNPLYDWQDSVQPENNCYWYHPDHLGSSSWITHTNGHAVQHLHYLPWGEEFIDQRTTEWHAMYTFSAKEKDTETGYSYFGSRYYSSDLSIWLSVDPKAGEYPSLSPYVYCANNPVKLVDPNGEEIDWVMDKNGRIYWDENAKNQQTTKQGELYLGKEGQRSTGTDVWNYHSDGTVDEQKPVTISKKSEYVSSYKTTLEKFSEWENNFTNRSVGVLQSAYIFLVSPINDASVLFANKDIYGNQVTKEDKIWSTIGLSTFGTGKILKTLRLFNKVKKTKNIEHGIEAVGTGLDIKTARETYKKNKMKYAKEKK